MNLKGFDIIIPVYNEGKNIIELIKYLKDSSINFSKIYICYDFDNETSIQAIKNSKYSENKNIILIKNSLTGPCEAIKTGFLHSKAQAVVVYPADDFYNGLLLDKMYNFFLEGYDVVCPSRFIKGGRLKNCPILKYLLVRIISFTFVLLCKNKNKRSNKWL